MLGMLNLIIQCMNLSPGPVSIDFFFAMGNGALTFSFRFVFSMSQINIVRPLISLLYADN